MRTHMKIYLMLFLSSAIALNGCKKAEYSFGDIIAPANLALNTVISGVNATNPNGNGTGAVAISCSADKAITYKVDFGDGKSQVVPSGIITYKYTNPGTFDYVVTINAIGTGGAISTISKKIKVFVAFEIPTELVKALTNNASRTWQTDHDAPGHFGVSPTDAFTPIWYAAGPNTRDPLAYDDEIVFSKDNLNNIYMEVNNKGMTFMIGAATAFYGFSGGDGNYPLDTGGKKKLAFMGATSASTLANSTRIQFEVPGNGIINFGTGGTTYEILSVSESTLHIRSIGSDGNAWYQKLKTK